MARVFLGVSWPYANGPQHIGHLASTYVPADQFARFHRLRGDEVLMVSGSDMHGTPILVAAEREGRPPAEVSQRFHEVNRSCLERLGVSFDVFTTTHTVLHERTAGEVFLALLEQGYVRRRTETLPFCPKHRRFLPDRYLEGTCPHCGYEHARGDECDHCGRPLEPQQLGAPRCAIDGTPAEFRPSEHFYLELDRLQPKLAEYLAAVGGHWRPGVLAVAQNFLAEGLHPTAISRDLEWGVPIPLDGYDSKRLYVWFEALVGYLSASKEWAIRSGNPDAWRRYWEPGEPVRHYYFVGKDNKFHHTIVWPGMLLGVGGLQLPYDVPANEWLTLGLEKLSKSRSRAEDVFLPSLLERYPPDVIRFYAVLLAPQNHDTELDWDEFEKVRDEHLSNQYGNLVQRALIFARDRYEGRIPSPPDDWRPDLPDGVGARLKAAHERITAEYEAVRLKEALALTLEEVREGNRRFQEARPWDLEGPDRDRVVYEALWRVKALATWLAPVLPFSSAEVFRMLGFAEPPGPGDWGRVLDSPPPGQALGPIRPLFPRETETRPATGAPVAASGPTAPVAAVPWPPFAARSGRIRAATEHPSADKLYVLEVDIGEPKPRTIVAGLRPSYRSDELVGRSVVFLSNLAPRTIRRITSQGMVLAADDGDRAVLLEPPDGVPPGAFVEGATEADREISYEEFARHPLVVARVRGPELDGRTLVEVGDRAVSVAGSWAPGSTVVVRLGGLDAASGEVVAFGPELPVRPAKVLPSGTRVR
ncbi:MAG TPA: methionine--tRNA ligase [Thermoplasmata archaeon]|nr:methionine--tRNA ligase [Thermoplasmata archaeon]